MKARGVSIAKAVRDLDVHENVLRKWIREGTGTLSRRSLVMPLPIARHPTAAQAAPDEVAALTPLLFRRLLPLLVLAAGLSHCLRVGRER